MPVAYALEMLHLKTHFDSCVRWRLFYERIEAEKHEREPQSKWVSEREKEYLQ